MSTDSAAPVKMSRTTLVWLLIFLLGYLVIGSYVAWSAWSATPLTPPSAALGAPAPGLHIDSIAPGTIVRNDEPVGLLIFGGPYDGTTVTLVNGAPPDSARVLSQGQIYIGLTPQEQRSASRLAIAVRSGDPESFLTSNVVVVASRTADLTLMSWRLLWMDGQITQETRFLLLTLMMGSIAGVIASLQSLGGYRGNDRLFGKWAVHYFVSPFVAGGVALFLYLALRAGFLSGSAITIEPGLLPWGLLAIASLGGLFYDRTFLKLREVFLTLFQTGADDRKGKMNPRDEPPEDADADKTKEEKSDEPAAAPEIKTKRLAPAKVGEAYEGRLEAKGDPPNLSWSVAPDLPGGLQLHPGTGAISGTPVAAAAARTYVFTVENLEGARATTSLELEVAP